MHLLETAYQKAYAQRRTGTTAVRYLYDMGFLGPHLTLGHGVWLTEDDIDLVVETGTMICHNASSNLRLRSGVAPLNHFLARGELISHVMAGEWMDAGTIESLVDATTFAAAFAGELPLKTAQTIEAVDAEHVEPTRARR